MPRRVEASDSISSHAYRLITALARDTTGKLKPHERNVAFTILGSMFNETRAALTDGTKAIWLASETIARQCGMSANSKRRVRQHIQRLAELGVIRVEPRRHAANLFAPGDLPWLPKRADGSFDFAAMRGADSDASGQPDAHPGNPVPQSPPRVAPQSPRGGSTEPPTPAPQSPPRVAPQSPRERTVERTIEREVAERSRGGDMDNFADSQPYRGSLSRPVLIFKEECVWPGEQPNEAEEALMRNHGLSLAEARELAAEGDF